MREALRVLRDLYSARHYCRSFVPRIRISSPSPTYFYPFPLPFLLRLFTLFSSFLLFFFLLFFSFSFLLLSPFTALLHPRLLCYRHNGRQWGLLIPYTPSITTERSIKRYTFRSPLLLSASRFVPSFLPPLYFDTRNTREIPSINRIIPIFRSRNRRVIDHYRIFNNSPHLSSTSFSTPLGERKESLFKKLPRNPFIIQRCVAKRSFSRGVLPFILIKRSNRDSFFQEMPPRSPLTKRKRKAGGDRAGQNRGINKGLACNYVDS